MLNRIFTIYFLTLIALGPLSASGGVFMLFCLSAHFILTWAALSQRIEITPLEVRPLVMVNVSLLFVSLVAEQAGKI